MVEETLPVMLEAMWAANVMDIKQTLAKVLFVPQCEKCFSNLHVTSLASIFIVRMSGPPCLKPPIDSYTQLSQGMHQSA